MCDENIEIGVTEITNNILVSATPTDQIIDINVTEQNEDVTLNITPSVVEVNIDVTQHLVTEQVTVDANTCVNIIDVSVTDATENVTLNITPSIVEVNINRGGGSGSGVWGSITGTLSDQTDLQVALNAKQNALGYTPVPTTRTLTINGVTYDLSANRSWTVAGGLSGSGTTNYLSKWTGASALGNSLVYDDGTNVMIGTNASLYKLTVNTATNVNFGVGRTSLFGTNDAVFLNSVNDTYGSIPFTLNASHIGLYIGYSEKLRINASGNVLIGTTSGITGGGLLQVNGIINSGEYGLLGGYVGLDTTPTTTPSTAGTLSWNDTDGTADLKLKGGNVTLQIGQEEVVRVVNKTGATLNEADFRAVRIRSVAEGGSQGQRLAVVLAQANNDANSATTIGLVTESISNNQEGFITTFGNVSEIDTTGAKSYGGLETWVDGDMLYLSPTYAGYLTNVKPSAPQHMVIVGYVVYAHAVHGKIFVKVDNGYELDELHNVAITSPTNGQALVYDSANSVWKNSTISSGVSGSGTTNYLPKWSSSSALANSIIYNSVTGIGINTTTPRAALEVNGQIYASNGAIWSQDNQGFLIGDLTAGASYAFISGVGSTGAASYLSFSTNYSERLRIIANGNVGIGLTNPAYKLDVVGDVNITGSYRVNGVVIGAGTGTVTSVSATVPTGFSISGSPITSSGTLAITFATGYSLPTTASQTNWDTAYSNRITSASSPLSISANVISIAQASTSTSGYLSSTDWNTFNNKQAALTNPVTGTGTNGYLAKWNGTSAINGSLIYDNGSHIGIGTTAPDTYSQFGTGGGFTLQTSITNGSSNINVVGNGSGFGGLNFGNATIRRAGIYGLDGSALGFYTNSTNTGSGLSERLRILSNGNVGIGTTSPSAFLHIKGGNNNSLWVDNDGSQYTPIYIANNGSVKAFAAWDNTNALFQIGTATSSTVQFIANNAERMRITSGGLVGIGVTSPNKTLEVYSSYSGNYTAQLKLFGSTSISGRALYLGSFANTGYITMGGTFANGWTTDTTTAMSAIYMDSNSADSSIAFATTTINNSAPIERMRIKSSGIINLANVPTSSAGLSSGDIYKIGGALMIV